MRAATQKEDLFDGSTSSRYKGGRGQRAFRLLFLIVAFLAVAAVPAGAAEMPVHISSFGPDGSSQTNFEEVGPVAVDQGTGDVYVADVDSGEVLKFDAGGQPTDFGGTAPNVIDNAITGIAFLAEDKENQLAVDSGTHDLYVTAGTKVLAFEQDGEPATFTAGSNSGSNELTGFSLATGVAVDSAGAIYVSDYNNQSVSVFSSTGESLTQFATPTAGNLAIGPDGTAYVIEWGKAVLRYSPSTFPVASSTTYSGTASLVGGEAQTVTTNPENGDVYVTERLVVNGAPAARIAVYDATGSLLGHFAEAIAEGPASEGKFPSPALGINGSTGAVYVPTKGGGGETQGYSQVQIFGPLVIPVLAPTITGTSALNVTESSVKLRAQINPNTLDTSYYFEYGLEDCSEVPDPCAPLSSEGVGSGHEPVWVSRQVLGLQAGAVYHYRVVATNSLGTTYGPDRTLTTAAIGGARDLADARVWEMVTPRNKYGGQIKLAGMVQAAADGSGLVFPTLGSIDAAPEGNRAVEPSSVLARREGAGVWQAKDVTLPQTQASGVGLQNEYVLFDAGLGNAIVEPHDPAPQSAEASERTPYLRQNTERATYIPLVSSKEGFENVPPGTVFGGEFERSAVEVAGASSDLRHIVVKSDVPLIEGTQAGNLYLWQAGKLTPVSQLPAAEGGTFVAATLNLGSGVGSVRHAISEDGSRVFWSVGGIGTGSIDFKGLYVRAVAEAESVRLDVVQSGAGEGAANPAFQGASADGTMVYFTDPQKLTAGASPTGRDLYACELAGPPGAGCTSLSDISAPLGGSGESAEVQGLVSAISDDGAEAYFVAKGRLADNQNGEGDSAVAGEPNLYLWKRGDGTRFIATLSFADDRSWGRVEGETPGYQQNLVASGSPSGRYFAFMSQRSLTGQDSIDATADTPVEQVFRYDAVTDDLVCVSCNPSGASPNARQVLSGGGEIYNAIDSRELWDGRWLSATLASATPSAGSSLLRYPLYRPRSMLDNGRVFFNSADSLVSGDSNGEWDVYQYEPTGVGTCSASSSGALVSRSEDGCVGLISSGTADEEAVFLDASADGNDAFFVSSARLSALDEDSAGDVYDARVDGTAAVRPAQVECLGEACRPAVEPPEDTTPASATFHGSGNARSGCPGRAHPAKRKGARPCRAHRHKQHRKTGHGQRNGGGK